MDDNMQTTWLSHDCHTLFGPSHTRVLQLTNPPIPVPPLFEIISDDAMFTWLSKYKEKNETLAEIMLVKLIIQLHLSITWQSHDSDPVSFSSRIMWDNTVRRWYVLLLEVIQVLSQSQTVSKKMVSQSYQCFRGAHVWRYRRWQQPIRHLDLRWCHWRPVGGAHLVRCLQRRAVLWPLLETLNVSRERERGGRKNRVKFVYILSKLFLRTNLV